ncbi:hypothetical protein Rhal01_02091 [Rubritalea halochordaticola]|uniref:DUF1461 domain-containing protein n=1 Tax=Rubritalea halochordaticola TaxID=714537 RepID=A0ABP9V1P6_9BACT
MQLVLKNSLRYFLLITGALFLMTVLNVVLWDWAVDGRLYHTTGLFRAELEFLNPGHWVTADYELVAELDLERSFKDPGKDQVLQGWSDTKLLVLWWGMVLASIFGALGLAWWLGPRGRKRSA